MIKLGVTPGPKVKDILQKLLDALLDGKIRSRKGEEKLAENSILL